MAQPHVQSFYKAFYEHAHLKWNVLGQLTCFMNKNK